MIINEVLFDFLVELIWALKVEKRLKEPVIKYNHRQREHKRTISFEPKRLNCKYGSDIELICENAETKNHFVTVGVEVFPLAIKK